MFKLNIYSDSLYKKVIIPYLCVCMCVLVYVCIYICILRPLLGIKKWFPASSQALAYQCVLTWLIICVSMFACVCTHVCGEREKEISLLEGLNPIKFGPYFYELI